MIKAADKFLVYNCLKQINRSFPSQNQSHFIILIYKPSINIFFFNFKKKIAVWIKVKVIIPLFHVYNIFSLNNNRFAATSLIIRISFNPTFFNSLRNLSHFKKNSLTKNYKFILCQLSSSLSRLILISSAALYTCS